VCFIDEGPALGNVHEQPLADIVHGAEGWRFYRSLEQAPAACRGCAKRARCRGGSRAMSRAMLGEWFGLDPRCTGDVTAQGFFPLCVMQREDIQTGTVEGFAEHVVG
jgi:radical SAM protein with 4Fe4S-binding SPASM domain